MEKRGRIILYDCDVKRGKSLKGRKEDAIDAIVSLLIVSLIFRVVWSNLYSQ
jgi:hypothetical protein